MPASRKTDGKGSSSGAPGAVASVVSEGKAGGPAYPMFEARGISAEGAFLAGPLLLEVDEAFTVELAFADGKRLRARARVERVEQGAEPGVGVRFVDLPEAARKDLEGRGGPGGK
jgi:hypothetical protein